MYEILVGLMDVVSVYHYPHRLSDNSCRYLDSAEGREIELSWIIAQPAGKCEIPGSRDKNSDTGLHEVKCGRCMK